MTIPKTWVMRLNTCCLLWEVKATPAKRLINTDNLSGVFAEVCPEKIDMDGLLLAGRQSMHRQDKMPWAFHEFWLRDMEHANGETAALTLDIRSDTGENRPYAFFPGCQLGAASPALVLAAWDELLALNADKRIPLSGMILRCCGAPAEWAGDEELYAAALDALRGDWEALGRPALACACPSCMRILGVRAPEIETISIYELFSSKARPDNSSGDDRMEPGDDAISKYELFSGEAQPEYSYGDDTPEPVSDAMQTQPTGLEQSPSRRSVEPANVFAVFDPCAAARLTGEGKSDTLRQSVRSLAKAMNLEVLPLPVQERVTRCCGFGGQPECADPAFVKKVREDRAAESPLPYLCYCMNCREAFLKAGKPSAHILELRYANTVDALPGLSPTKRRANRESLRDLAGARIARPCSLRHPAAGGTPAFPIKRRIASSPPPPGKTPGSWRNRGSAAAPQSKGARRNTARV